MFAICKTCVAIAAALVMTSTVHAAALSAGASLKIVAFGSSSTEGVGASAPENSYPSQLQILLGRALPASTSVDVVNRGIGGEDADDMVRRLDKDVITRHPDLVIWQTGSNDPMRHVPLDRFERETRAGIHAMQKAGIKVMLMEPQWCPRLAEIGNANAYRDIVRKVGADMGVPVIRRYDLMRAWLEDGVITEAEMISDDHLHMRDKGYALLAGAIASSVLQMRTDATKTAVAGRSVAVR